MKRLICSAIVIVLLLATPIAAFAASDPIDYGETVTGSISDTNWNYFWYFDGKSGDKVSFTMRATSGDLDAWLTLWKQNSSGDWDYLVTNNDGAGGSDAKITYTLAASGRYFIETTRYQDKSGSTSGSYSLALALLSGSSSSSGGSSSSGSSSGYSGKPHDNWDDLTVNCPSGIRCIDATAIQWSNLNALTYCVASASGTTQKVGSSNITISSNSNYENDLEEAIDYWDGMLNSFSMREVSCSSNPDFVFGLIDDSDLSSLMGESGFLGVAYPPDPKPARIFSSSSSASLPSGAARQLNLAHELGHGLGLGHSQTSGSMMYPSHPGAGKTLTNTALANDSRDQLTNNYPSNVTWGGSTIHNTGFVKDVIEAKNGVAVSKTLNYAGTSGQNVFLCLIEGYWARGSNYGDDADMGWNCTFNFDDNARKVTFTLAPSYSSEGKIRATVLAFNTNAYTLHHLYFFRAYGENPSPICIGGAEYNDHTSTARYNVTPRLTSPSGSIPIVAVTRYDTWSDDEPDDDMSFGVYLENNTFNAYAWDGCGLIEGWVAVISPSSTNYQVQNCWVTAGDYSPYNNGSTFNLPSTNPSCNVSIQNGWNNEVFSSLMVYNANGDDHFSASNIVNDNGNTLKTTLWADYGDDKSNVWFEIIGLKSAP